MTIHYCEHELTFIHQGSVYWLVRSYNGYQVYQTLAHVFEPRMIFEIESFDSLPIYFQGRLIWLTKDRSEMKICDLNGNVTVHNDDFNIGTGRDDFKFIKPTNYQIISVSSEGLSYQYSLDIPSWYEKIFSRDIPKIVTLNFEEENSFYYAQDKRDDILFHQDGLVLAFYRGNLVQTQITPHTKIIFGQRTTQNILPVQDLEASQIQTIYLPIRHMAYCIVNQNRFLSIDLIDNSYLLKPLPFTVENFSTDGNFLVLSSPSESKLLIQAL